MQTAEERQKKLWIASQQYVSGELPLDDLEKVERIQAEKLRNAMLVLSKRSVRQKILERICTILKLKSVYSVILG